MKRWGRIFRLQLQRKFDQIHVRQNGTLIERDVRHEVVGAITATALNSVRPVLNLPSATLACGVLLSCCPSNEYFGGHMAKIIEFYIPQGFRKVSRWFPPAERGKVLAFPLAARKSA
jgi:hypothetical protein